MRNYFDSINTKIRLLYLGLAVAMAPVTSTFAILPMMSEISETSTVVVDSVDDQVASNLSQVQQQKIKVTTQPCKLVPQSIRQHKVRCCLDQ